MWKGLAKERSGGHEPSLANTSLWKGMEVAFHEVGILFVGDAQGSP